MGKGSTDRGGRTDVRQRRAFQKLGKDPFSTLGIEAGDGVVLDSALGTISVDLATDPGLAFSSGDLIVIVGAGLELTVTGIEIDLAANGGLAFSSGDLILDLRDTTPALELTANGIGVIVGAGLELTATGVEIDLAADPGLAFSSGDLTVLVGAGLELTSSGVEIDLAANPGLAFSSGDLIVIVGNGLELTETGVEIDLLASGGLAFSAGDLAVTVGVGLELTATGVEIDLGTDPGLEFSSGDIRVKVKASGGITRDSDGLSQTQVSDSGVYTPTLTNILNITSSGVTEASWTRQGDIVTVAMAVVIEATNVDAATLLLISLPVAPTTEFGAAGIFGAAGVGALQGPPSDGVSAVVTHMIGTKSVLFAFVPSVTGAVSRTFTLMFQYNLDQTT